MQLLKQGHKSQSSPTYVIRFVGFLTFLTGGSIYFNMESTGCLSYHVIRALITNTCHFMVATCNVEKFILCLFCFYDCVEDYTSITTGFREMFSYSILQALPSVYSNCKHLGLVCEQHNPTDLLSFSQNYLKSIKGGSCNICSAV